jgi:predicted NBD/HSP70 family sugar kinase
MGRARVVGVLAENLPGWWPQVRRWVEAAVKADGLLSAESVRQAIATRDMQLWLVFQGDDLAAACVTEISVFPLARVLSAVVVGGERMPRWIADLNDHLTRYALAHDCTKFNAPIARRGWRPFARALGWSERATYWKDLAE